VKLSTRMTMAMVALVLFTAIAISWLSYRNVVPAVLPRVIERVQIHAHLLCSQLKSYVSGARDDIISFQSAVALRGMIRAQLAGGVDPVDGVTEARWRQRMASRFAAELAAKPAYESIRIINLEDARELVRADRYGPNGAIRIVPDDKLQSKIDRGFFQGARADPAGAIYVSPVELTPDHSMIRPVPIPVLHVAATVQSSDHKPFCLVVINVDMRPILHEIATAAEPDGRMYVIDSQGNYLVHPNPARQFDADHSPSARWQNEYPALVTAFNAGRVSATPIIENTGERAIAVVAPTDLDGGPRVAVMEIAPEASMVAAIAPLGRSTSLVGLAAALFAGLLAALLSRSLARPLVQMKKAVEAFGRGKTLPVPAGSGEIGVLAGAFTRMMAEVKEKTASLEREIAEHRRTEEELARHTDQARLFSAAVESSEDAIIAMTLEGLVTRWNPAAERLFGWSADQMLGRSIDVIVPDDRRAEISELLQKIQSGESVQAYETVRRSKDHKLIDISLSVSPIRLPSGTVVGACKIARDIRESKKAKELLEQESNERRRIADVLDNTITSIADAVLVADNEGNIVLANPAAERLMGVAGGMSQAQWSQCYETFAADGTTPIALPDRPLMRAIHGEAVASSYMVVRRADRTKALTLLAKGGPLSGDSHRHRGAVVVYRDITEAMETERQLRQSQKMEAIGQLTGGIAHDFNNILTVITGTIEMLADGVADQPELAVIVKMIDQAATRGGHLTQDLLAFSRKQPLQPRETNVNELLVEAGRLLRSTLGEHIEIESMLKENAALASVDPNQLVTALLNLALNARDAMPHGGKLTLETGNVVISRAYARANPDAQAGSYVMIAVSDTGSGISAANLEKVFEPFFTTKEVGKGTGLGLSMVYGFIKQSGGHIKIYSEEGHGTTVKMYLPRAMGPAESAVEVATEPIRGGSETVLVVEDDPLVRDYVVAQVRALGYTTLAAINATEALAFIDSTAKIDLLFTDVVVPGALTGRQLADTAVKRRPELKVLFTSGYTENAIVHHGRLDPGVLLLPKPYRKADLARMLRAALDVIPATETHPRRSRLAR
jgi:PAS domain S-box-containing protein